MRFVFARLCSKSVRSAATPVLETEEEKRRASLRGNKEVAPVALIRDVVSAWTLKSAAPVDARGTSSGLQELPP